MMGSGLSVTLEIWVDVVRISLSFGESLTVFKFS